LLLLLLLLLLRELTEADVSVVRPAAVTYAASVTTTDGSAAKSRGKATIRRYRTAEPHA
jgi:hypothetical protein